MGGNLVVHVAEEVDAGRTVIVGTEPHDTLIGYVD